MGSAGFAGAALTHIHLKHVSTITAHRGNPLWAAGGVETGPYFLTSATEESPYVFGSSSEPTILVAPEIKRSRTPSALPGRRAAAKSSSSSIA